MYKKLIVLVGLPASGKSTYVKNINHLDSVVISSDAIREELNISSHTKESNGIVFKEVHDRIFKYLNKNSNVSNIIVDATNLSKKDRNFYERIRKNTNKYKCKVEYHLIWSSILSCIERDKNRQNPVGETTIKRLCSKFIVPPKDSTIIIKNDKKIFSYKDLLDKFGIVSHKSMYHLESINTHILMCDYKGFTYLHDIGKFFTQVQNGGFTSYPNHANVSTWEMIGYSENLSYDDLINVENHMTDKQKEIDTLSEKSKENLLIDENSRFSFDIYTTKPLLNSKYFRYITKYTLEMFWLGDISKTYREWENTFSKIGLDKNVVLNELLDSIDYTYKLRGSVFEKMSNRFLQDTKVLAYGLGKFQNIQEKPFNDIFMEAWRQKFCVPKGKVKYYEKFDGSCIYQYKIDGVEYWTTRGSGQELLEEFNIKIEKAKLNSTLLEVQDGDTIVYELIGKDNKIVVEYKDDLKLIPIAKCNEIGVTMLQKEIKKPNMSLENIEGYIIQDETGRLFKMKTKWYLNKHKFLSISDSKIIDAIDNNSIDDLMSMVDATFHDKIFYYLDIHKNNLQKKKDAEKIMIEVGRKEFFTNLKYSKFVSNFKYKRLKHFIKKEDLICQY